MLNAYVISACLLSTAPVFAADKDEITVVAKVTGIPWFNRMAVGINQAAKKLDVNTIILVQNNAKVLEPVLEKCATKAS